MERLTGKVKWFNQLRGYGFLESDQGELFFHISELEGYQQEQVVPGDEVEFEIGDSPKGKKAVKLKKL